MPELTYSLQFKGAAAPKEGNPAVLNVRATAPGRAVRCLVGATGLTSSSEPAGGDEAVFESEVSMTGPGTFDETGRITFGSGNVLRFSNVAPGHVAPAAESGINAGAVIWKIDGGEGQFAGASGLITSNFFFGATGEVTDNQTGVIFLK